MYLEFIHYTDWGWRQGGEGWRTVKLLVVCYYQDLREERVDADLLDCRGRQLSPVIHSS